MKKLLQNTGATAILISIAGIGGVLEKGANPVNVIVLALIGAACCLIADKLQDADKEIEKLIGRRKKNHVHKSILVWRNRNDSGRNRICDYCNSD